MSKRHIKLCREAIEAESEFLDTTLKKPFKSERLETAVYDLRKAHPPELLLAMHEIKRYHVGRGRRIVCNGCGVQSAKDPFRHAENCPVARYEEMTND